MGRVIGSILLTLAIIYIVPFIVYSVMTLVTSLEPPKDVSPVRFLSSIFVSKVGKRDTKQLLEVVLRVPSPDELRRCFNDLRAAAQQLTGSTDEEHGSVVHLDLRS